MKKTSNPSLVTSLATGHEEGQEPLGNSCNESLSQEFLSIKARSDSDDNKSEGKPKFYSDNNNSEDKPQITKQGELDLGLEGEPS